MFVLTDIERLALLSGCTGLLGLVILVTACFACPSCWLNKKITQKQRREEENKMHYIRNNFQVSFADKDPPPPYESTSRTSFIDMKSPPDFSKRLVSVNSISSACSDTDSVTGIPLPLISDAEVPTIEVPENPPFDRGNEAGELQTRSYGGRCNPYCIIGLYDAKGFNKKKRRRSGPIALHEFNSTIVKKNNGQILLGLCYLPTAERMTVAVLKANNLKKANEIHDGADFYVQAMAIYGGKIFEKRKTSRRPSSQFPVFNEMLMFDVPFTKLDHVVLLLAVYSTIPQASLNSHEVQLRVASKDTCIGKVVIGASSRKHSLNHWNAMRNSPRRQVIQWHELR